MRRHPTPEDYLRVERVMRQFMRDNPRPASTPGRIDTNDYDEGSRRAVYADYRNVRL